MNETPVRVWISNIAFPTSLEELDHILAADGGRFDTELILQGVSGVRWTVPVWAKRGDIMIFMHSVSAIGKIRALKKQLPSAAASFSPETIENMMRALDRAAELYRACGGKLIGTAQLASDAGRGFTEPFRHWKSVTYAPIEGTWALAHPVDRARFRDFITISRTGAVTPVYGEAFKQLRAILLEENSLPAYVMDACAKTSAAGRGSARGPFETEERFRAELVDPVLKILSPAVYRECRCKKPGIPDSFADNVILIGKKYLPVEVKLHWTREGIRDQLWKYCNDTRIDLAEDTAAGPDKIWKDHAVLFDPEKIWLYDAGRDRLAPVFNVADLDEDGVYDLRDALGEALSGDS